MNANAQSSLFSHCARLLDDFPINCLFFMTFGVRGHMRCRRQVKNIFLADKMLAGATEGEKVEHKSWCLFKRFRVSLL